MSCRGRLSKKAQQTPSLPGSTLMSHTHPRPARAISEPCSQAHPLDLDNLLSADHCCDGTWGLSQGRAISTCVRRRRTRPPVCQEGDSPGHRWDSQLKAPQRVSLCYERQGPAGEFKSFSRLKDPQPTAERSGHPTLRRDTCVRRL